MFLGAITQSESFNPFEEESWVTTEVEAYKEGVDDMLGEQIIPDERGKVMGTRVCPSPPGQGPKMELTFQSTGKILGVDFSNTGTLQSVPKSEGVLYFEGQGVVTTKDGELASWTTHGVGKPTGANMAASLRGTVFFQTSSQKLAPLNSMCVVVAAEVDESGNMSAQLWEWK